MKTINITGIGADIELFLKDKETNEIVSAEGFIKGSKYDPYVFDENKFFSTSLDNVLAEFTIPPAVTPEEFLTYIKKGVDYINSTIPTNLCTTPLPAAMLDDRFLFTDNAATFGCEPDFNAYTKDIQFKPGGVDYRLRSGGGHIHIGYEDPTPYKKDVYLPDEERSSIIKALDLFIGVPSIIMEPDNDRKNLYGCAGSFRPKPYGVEYRTPSNFYLSSDNLIKWVHASAIKAIDWLNEGNVITNRFGESIRKAINNNNKTSAKRIIKNLNLELA